MGLYERGYLDVEGDVGELSFAFSDVRNFREYPSKQIHKAMHLILHP